MTLSLFSSHVNFWFSPAIHVFFFVMTSINLTLLLGLSLKKIASEKKADKKKKDKKDEKEKKGGEDKDTAKGKKGKKGKKQQKVEPEEEVVKPRNLFEVGSPKKSAHIEYELVPDRPPFKVDVNCWGEFARVKPQNRFNPY